MTYAEKMQANIERARMEIKIRFGGGYGPPSPELSPGPVREMRKTKAQGPGDFSADYAPMFSFAWIEQRHDFKAQQSAFRRARGLND